MVAREGTVSHPPTLDRSEAVPLGEPSPAGLPAGFRQRAYWALTRTTDMLCRRPCSGGAGGCCRRRVMGGRDVISNRTRWICLGMVTAAMLAGCSTASPPSASVAAGSGTTGVPAATLAGASATADPVMAQHDAAVARATAVIHALGGDVSADEPTTVLVADPESSQPGPFVQIGDADHRWEVGWTPQGVLRWVFTVTQPDAAAALTQTQAAARVSETLARLGLSLGAPDSLVYGSDWSAEWSRKIDGVPALGDGTSLHLAPDGSFGSYRFAESATAPKPASLLAKTQALSK